MGEASTTSWFMESMWTALPVGLLEMVFTFLPITSLCRFRALSKKWNRYISGPTFKHAQASPAEEYVLVTLRWGMPGTMDGTGGWDVLDVAKTRFLTFSDDFLTKHVQQQGLIPMRTYLAAADGGLFCMRYFFRSKNSGLLVCNPVLKTVKQLPHGFSSDSGQTVVMSTNRVSMEYEIFVFNHALYYTVGEPSKPPESILIYNSKSGSWRTGPFRSPVNLQIWWGSLTIFENNLYCIFNKGSREGIVSYNKETGVVSELDGIEFPSAPKSYLVVSKDKLFCVVPVGDLTCDIPSVEIFEINIADKSIQAVTAMPRELLIWVLGHDLDRGFCEMESKIKVATGSVDSILICTVVGRCVAYSLSKKSWYQYPDDYNLLKAYCKADWTREELYGSSYCLSLCTP